MAAKFESEIKSSSCKKHTSHILNNRKDAKIYAHKTSCANNNNIYSLQKMLADSLVKIGLIIHRYYYSKIIFTFKKSKK